MDITRTSARLIVFADRAVLSNNVLMHVDWAQAQLMICFGDWYRGSASRSDVAFSDVGTCHLSALQSRKFRRVLESRANSRSRGVFHRTGFNQNPLVGRIHSHSR